MRKLTMVLTVITLVCCFTTVGPVKAQADSGLIWRPRISPTDAPKTSSPAPSCDSDPNDNIGCSQGPLETTIPIDLAPGGNYLLNLPYHCSDGRIEFDADWLGRTPPEILINQVRNTLRSSNNHAVVQLGFDKGPVPEIVLHNPTTRKMTVTKFGAKMGCNVSSRIDNVWREANVYENNIKGMRLHIAFAVYNQNAVDSAMVAFFSYQDGNQLNDAQGHQLSAIRYFKPSYDNAHYNDLSLFIAYRDLPIPKGTNNLRFQIWLFDKLSKGQFGHSNYVNFTLTRS